MKTLPNLLSFARLLVAPYLFFLLWHARYGEALLVLLSAGVTDGLDGLLARVLHAQSRMGELLDPIADKVLLSGAFMTLALHRVIEPWLVALVAGRDLMILTLAGAALASFSNTEQRFPPTIWGKASTVAQIVFLVCLLGSLAGKSPALLTEVAKWIAVALTAWSGIDYARRAAMMKW